jgi:hypothetical protein
MLKKLESREVTRQNLKCKDHDDKAFGLRDQTPSPIWKLLLTIKENARNQQKKSACSFESPSLCRKQFEVLKWQGRHFNAFLI